ncbi:MAG: CsgG/HfaB family protein [Armatimonadota bacterium]|jgi:curli biogenesis system outer membrane secretion channel CsgG
MRRAVVVVGLCAFCLSVAAAALAASTEAPPKPPPYAGLKKRLAVLPISAGGGATSATRGNMGGSTVAVTTTWNSDAQPGAVGAALTEQLTTALVDSGRFVVLERAALGEVLGEQDLATSGRVNPETAAPTGKVTGAEWLIKAAITEYTDRKTSEGGGFSLPGLHVGGGTREAYVALDVRIIDAATGQVVDSVKADSRAKSSGTRGGVTIGSVSIGAHKEDNTPIGQATRAALVQAVDFICQRMEKVPWESRVVAAEDGRVTITGGLDRNIKVGDVFAVLHRGKALTDPATGEVLEFEDTLLGTLKITEVRDKVATGRMIEGKVPVRGDVVRVVGQQ